MRRIALVCTFWGGITATTVAKANNPVPSYQAGQDYKILNSPTNHPISSAVHVKEFFLYSCSHCFQFEVRLETWVRHLGSDVQFSFSPVIYGPSSRNYARIYGTERARRLVGQLHDKVFDAIHRLHRPWAQWGTIRPFFNAHGLSIKRFNRPYESQPVTQSMHRARIRMCRFGVRSVPSQAAVRYWLSDRTARRNPRMPRVADYFIAQTRRARHLKESK